MKEASHLVRLAVLFAGGLALFVFARQQIVPADFGKYGHFRARALDKVRSHPTVYAGRATCEMCHTDQLAVLKAGRHAGVSCEACHGPQTRHANDLSAPKPTRPDSKLLCAQCHEANAAKPKRFPQVISKEHSGGEACKSCHAPHRPKFPKES